MEKSSSNSLSNHKNSQTRQEPHRSCLVFCVEKKEKFLKEILVILSIQCDNSNVIEEIEYRCHVLRRIKVYSKVGLVYMEENQVTFKGTVNGLTIIMKPDETFDEIVDQINKKVKSASKFFDGAVLNVKYKGKKLTEEQENHIYTLLKEKSGAQINSFAEDPEPTQSSAIEKSGSSLQKMKMKTVFFKGIDEGNTKFHRGTLRSGQLIHFDGNVVILGDVNPGAEVVASGNVIVMGALRGIVHAGADGNKGSMIAALNLSPTQLRIADIIARAPDGDEGKNILLPELASIKNDQVYIERYLPQR
jgi:septum site-determining protein MinC